MRFLAMFLLGMSYFMTFIAFGPFEGYTEVETFGVATVLYLLGIIIGLLAAEKES